MRRFLLLLLLAPLVVLAEASAAPPPIEWRLVMTAKEGEAFHDLAISSDGKVVAFAVGLGTAVGDLGRASLLRWFQPGTASALGGQWLAFAGPDGEWLATAHEHDHVRVWSASTGAKRMALAPTWDGRDEANQVGARRFAASPERREVALAYWHGVLEFVDLKSPSKRQKISFGDDAYAHAMAFSTDGERLALLASRTAEKGVRVNVYARGPEQPAQWRLESSFVDVPPEDGSEEAKRPTHVWSRVALDPDGSRVYAAGAYVSREAPLPRARVLRAWSVRDERRLWSVHDDDHAIGTLLLFPNGNGLFAGRWTSAVFLDPATGAVQRRLKPHPESHDAFATDRLGNTLWAITGHNGDSALIAWDVSPEVVTPR